MSKINGKTAHQISDCVRALVLKGELKPGDSLPSVRDLANELEVNRNTVASSYQRLVKMGIAQTYGRHGTCISQPPQAGEQEGMDRNTALIDLADGNPNPEWLPAPARLIPSGGTRSYLYGDETVLPELRQFGIDWLGPECLPGWEMELTHGAVDAIERLAWAHLVAGDMVAIESPCFLGTINALRLAGMNTVAVELDEYGMLPGSLDAALRAGARAVFITPRAQNPTGCSLSAERARDLQRVLAGHPTVLVVVDDHFGLLEESPYYSAIPDNHSCWALIRSVSKGLGPDMRLAFVGSDAVTMERLRTRLSSGMNWVSHILQAMAFEGLSSAYSRSKMAEAREGYALRRAELHSELATLGISAPCPSGGFNIWIPLTRSARDVAYELAKRGWLVRVGTGFDVHGVTQAIRVTISQITDGQAKRFARDLKACL
ncbi:putative transcriptional regulatory protein PtsJ [Pseudomonas caricapapayae]|uniref:Putative transcriptional regulatory protein PtsJ n=1 Tax=Pseudomonas caricapapayae TaxID=46678 RepID=A0A3M6EI06_9PSED|nr:aminotransferase class I/II-fold pyridoxal phosphate-dependent enzyme [Pseudomonas caricapapayae]RMV67980.1 putative transcriptional regulatory protein PtsJ [Pseudomonas caricapapayae]